MKLPALILPLSSWNASPIEVRPSACTSCQTKSEAGFGSS